MATLTLITPEAVPLRYELAGAGSRFAAGLLDLLLFAAGYLSATLVVVAAAQLDPTGLSQLARGVLGGGFLAGLAVYPLVFGLLGGGRTPAKRALGLVVKSHDGFPAAAGQVVLRSLLWPLDALLLVPLPIGLLVIAATRGRQRLGDFAAGTVVVREERGWARTEPFPKETWSALERRELDLAPGLSARFGDEDLELLRDLWTRVGLDAERRRRLFVRTARHYARRLGLARFDDARVVLKELYLFLREARA